MVSGALATSVDWNEDDETSELYKNTAADAKADLETLINSVTPVVSDNHKAKNFCRCMTSSEIKM